MKIKKLLYLLIIISLIFSGIFIFNRNLLESKYRAYEIAVGYNTIERLAMESGSVLEEYFAEFASSGIDTIYIEEDTIDSISETAYSTLKSHLEGVDLHISGNHDELLNIKERLSASLTETRSIEFVNEEELVVEGKPEDIIYYDEIGMQSNLKNTTLTNRKVSRLQGVGLGFDKAKIEMVKSLGVNLNLRPSFNFRYQSALDRLEYFLEMVKEYSNQKYILFAGTESYLSSNESLTIYEQVKNRLVENDMAVAFIESSNQRGNLIQDGFEPVVNDREVGKIRAFTTWDYIQKKYDYGINGHNAGEEIANVYYRAISERNVALIIIRPFVNNQNTVYNVADYKRVIESMQPRLEKLGFTKGLAESIGKWYPNQMLKFPIALGISAAAALLFENIFRTGTAVQLLILIVGTIFSSIFYILGKKTGLGDTLFNLLGIITYPSLSLCYILNQFNKVRSDGIVHRNSISYLNGIKVFMISIMISMIGTFMEVSLLSGTDNLLELVIFRGVKVSQLLPVAISVFIFNAFVGFNREAVSDMPRVSFKEIMNELNKNIKLWHAVLAGLFVAAIGILILRSGNTNVSVSSTELLFRNTLEVIFPARPRTKAILFGYPAIILLMYAAYKKRGIRWGLILALCISIGQANLMNTFSHIRTQYFISLYRVGGEIACTVVIALIQIVILTVLYNVYDKLMHDEK